MSMSKSPGKQRTRENVLRALDRRTREKASNSMTGNAPGQAPTGTGMSGGAQARSNAGTNANLYEQNLALLNTQSNDFFTVVTSSSYSHPDIVVSEGTQPGNFAIKSGGIRLNLHSAYDIEREMDELFATLFSNGNQNGTGQNDENQIILIFGLGCGHCIDYIKNKRIKYKRVVIFEPYNNIFQEVLKKRDVRELLGRRNVYIHLFKIPNEMASLLIQETMSSRNVSILYHISYRTLFRDLYDNVLRTFIAEKNSLNTSIATFEYFLYEWTNNQIKAIKKQDKSAAVFFGKFKGVPGIVAAAGPSLEKHYERLKGVYGKAVIVSPGSASRILNAQNIQSHISMSIDSQAHQADIYNDFRLNSVLVGSYRLNPKVHETFPNRVFRVVLNTEFLARYYNEWAGIEAGAVDDHASVASSAVDLLFNMGCNPIVLLGQDLCYYDNRLYADASANSLSGIYLNTIEDVDIHGNKVSTYGGFKAMQNDMENINIRYGQHVKMYNATESGLNIHGIENVTFDYIIDKYIKDNPFNVPEMLDGIFGGLDEARGIDDSCADEDEGEVTGEGKISAFYEHVLGECGKVEQVIQDKGAAFERFEKLKSRGVARNRLNKEIAYVASFNKRLEDIKFYSMVLFNSIKQRLTYYKAGANYISDSGEGYEGAEVYERILDGVVLDYVNKIKVIIATELLGEDALKSAIEGAMGDDVGGAIDGTAVAGDAGSTIDGTVMAGDAGSTIDGTVMAGDVGDTIDGATEMLTESLIDGATEGVAEGVLS